MTEKLTWELLPGKAQDVEVTDEGANGKLNAGLRFKTELKGVTVQVTTIDKNAFSTVRGNAPQHNVANIMIVPEGWNPDDPENRIEATNALGEKVEYQILGPVIINRYDPAFYDRLVGAGIRSRGIAQVPALVHKFVKLCLEYHEENFAGLGNTVDISSLQAKLSGQEVE